MWVPSEDEAVEMFARHFEALHRSGAGTKAEQQAESLKRSGDHKGHRIWMKVVERIRHLRKERKAAQLAASSFDLTPRRRIHAP